jgi:hypothetical protein
VCAEVRGPPRENGKKNTLPAPDRKLQQIDGVTEGIGKVSKSDVRDT